MTAGRDRKAAFAGAVLIAAVLVACVGLLGALPAIFAFGVLGCGRYPGAARLDRLIAGRRARSRISREPAAPPGRPVRALLSRGGGLIASSLAKRPPPLRLASS
ncbi:MAG: hypothetical protein ACHQJ5_06155 [Vicinamibacteria bacterium]|jgi:hypothetical protein